MSLIILMNSIICLITGVLFYFYIHEFKEDLKKVKVVTYFLFGSYFIFSSFIRIKMILTDSFQLTNFNIYDNEHLFGLLGLIANIMFGVFMFNAIKQEKNASNTKT